MPAFRLGTRGSALAVAQSTLIANRLRDLGYPVEIVTIRTEGDRTSGPLSQADTGVFAAALREALLNGTVDFAVHSYKDLPTAPVPGLRIAAVPTRADARDVLCCRPGISWETLPKQASVGTGSPRRIAQLLAARPDLDVVDIRGNVGTRLARLERDLDAVVLAAAGLERLGVAANPCPFDPEIMLPAPAQGALAIECRANANLELSTALAALDDPPTRWCALAERAVLARLQAGCSAPLGALATFVGGQIRLVAKYCGSEPVTASGTRLVLTDADAENLGIEVAEKLLAQGLPESVRGNLPRRSELPLSGQRLLLPDSVSDTMIEELRDAGADLTLIHLTDTEFLDPDWPEGDFDWVVITSTMTLTAMARAGHPLTDFAGANLAAVGPATKAAIENLGRPVALVPASGNGVGLARDFPSGSGRVLLPGSALMNERLAAGLAAKGWEVARVPVYTTVPAAPEARSGPKLDGVTALVVTAGSNARAAAQLLGTRLPVVTLGQPSAEAAATAGFTVLGVAETPTAAGLIAALTGI